MKFEPPNFTSQQTQTTTNKLAKHNPPPLHWTPTPPTNRNKTTHLHSIDHTNPCVGEGKKKKTAGQPLIATHNPSHHHVPATQQTQEELTTVEVENYEKKTQEVQT